MTDNQSIQMLVRWNQQKRFVTLNINDNLNAIETNIINAFELRQANFFHRYQIQFYDNTHENFIDLYSQTFSLFQNLLQILLSPDAPLKKDKDWILKIIPRNIEISEPVLSEPIADDTFTFQQEPDPTEEGQVKEFSPVRNRNQSSVRSIVSEPNTSHHLPREPMLEHNDTNQQIIARAGNQSPQSEPIDAEVVITSEHPCGLEFINELSPSQRLQYEGEMIRTEASKTRIGGVILRGYEIPKATGDDKTCPTIHFKIPEDKQNSDWFLHLCILTEADMDDIYYFHASKGIYPPDTIDHGTFGLIPHRKSYNPYVVQLTPDEIKNGIYIIRIKVCNIKGAPDHKHSKLREFARITNRAAYDGPTSLSENTSSTLKFSNERFHLGCILFCGDVRKDQCVSSLTMTEQRKQRRNNDQVTERKDGAEKRRNNQQNQRGRKKTK